METRQNKCESEKARKLDECKNKTFEIVALEERIAPSSLIGPTHVHLGPVQIHDLL